MKLYSYIWKINEGISEQLPSFTTLGSNWAKRTAQRVVCTKPGWIAQFRVLQTQLSCHRQQSPPGLVQVRQGHQRKHLRRILCQALVKGFPVAELALGDAEDMLHLGPHRGMFPVALALRGRELTVALGLVQHRPLHTGLVPPA